MRIVIASNIQNGIGLQKDYELLRGFLESLGHDVSGQQFDTPAESSGFDLGIWLETINEHLIPIAKRWYAFLNPEWTKPEYIRPIQRHCEKIFAKTRDAERVLRETFSGVHYVGFFTEDKRDLTVQRQRAFLHIGGNSGMRNTNPVIEAWRSYRYWNGPLAMDAPLTVVSNSKTVEAIQDVPGITFIRRATDEQVKELQNSHLFHLMPSAYEGFGHALHESLSVGAVLLTTRAAPMSEVNAPKEIPSIRQKKNNLGTLHEVSPAAIREAVPWFLGLPNYEVARMQIEARMKFEKGNQEFVESFSPHIECASATHSQCNIAEAGENKLVGSPHSLRIAVLGNFGPPHSTENDLLWTLRDMGHNVITFQENEGSAIDVARGCHGIDLFLWIHTHGWDTIDFADMLARLKNLGVRTASFHLDRYWGLNQLDRRENKIGKHSFWKTDFVFTADGGNHSAFAGRGVNHFWLPPGVVKRDCVLGTRREELCVDVGFVGSEGYHPEYPFRGELIRFLRSAYGERFRIFQGYRGQDLNDLYASIGVCVGDSCFGGVDYYFSDRAIETPGRGGFLIHPETKGLRIPGQVTFEPKNMLELQDKIDYYLQRERERICAREVAYNWVLENETYHNRMATLLKVCGL